MRIKLGVDEYVHIYEVDHAYIENDLFLSLHVSNSKLEYCLNCSSDENMASNILNDLWLNDKLEIKIPIDIDSDRVTVPKKIFGNIVIIIKVNSYKIGSNIIE